MADLRCMQCGKTVEHHLRFHRTYDAPTRPSSKYYPSKFQGTAVHCSAACAQRWRRENINDDSPAKAFRRFNRPDAGGASAC